MNSRIRNLKAIIVWASVLLIGLVMMTGCKKSEPSASSGSQEVVAAAVEQTICPVMGNPINKQYFTEYRGKKVYFCCPACKPEFEKNPEKYLAKLPQFKQ
jgi:YHS domain-containing protein